MLLNRLLEASLPPLPTPSAMPIPTSTPTSFLQDPFFTAIATWIGIGVAILFGIATVASTIVAAIYTVRKQRSRKEITHQILEDLSIVSKMPIEEESIGRQVEDRLKIVFDDKPVEDLRVVSIKVWNSGNVDAEIWNSKDAATFHRDFEKPIRFDFPGRQVVSGVVETNPSIGVIESEDLKNYIEMYLTPAPTQVSPLKRIRKYLTIAKISSGNSDGAVGSASDFVELPHCLLKPNQSITLRLLLIGPKSDIIKRGKLEQWTIIDFDPENQPFTIKFTRIIMLLLALLVVSIINIFAQNLFAFFAKNGPDFFGGNPFLTVSIFLGIWLFFLLLAIFYLSQTPSTTSSPTPSTSLGMISRIRKNGIRFRW